MSNLRDLITSPITGLSNVTLLEKLHSSNIIYAYQQLDIDVSKYFEEVEEVCIYKCTDTGYRFFFPFNLAAKSDFYEQLQQNNSYYSLTPEHKEAQKCIQEKSKVLEIGCGSGLFLNEIKDKVDACVGLEFNDAAILKATSYDLTVIKQDISDHAQTNQEKYDVVCAFQVLEHIPDVSDFINSCLKVMKKGGKLIFGVPNNNPFLYKYDKYHALNLPPHHIGLWDQVSLKNIENYFPMSLSQLILEDLQPHEYDYYYGILLENGRKKRRFLISICLFLLLNLKPYRFKVYCQSFFARFAQGRNILAVYTKD
jgi:SAM-dependent methyltransferase